MGGVLVPPQFVYKEVMLTLSASLHVHNKYKEKEIKKMIVFAILFFLLILAMPDLLIIIGILLIGFIDSLIEYIHELSL